MEGILIVERFVIESLYKKQKNLIELNDDTGLDKNILLNILTNLSFKKIILFKEGMYSLNYEKKEEWLEQINRPENKQQEIKEMFIALVNKYFKEGKSESNLSIRKVSLSELDEKVLNNHFKEIDHYLKNLERNKKFSTSRTGQEKVFIWGQGSYGNLMQEFLS